MGFLAAVRTCLFEKYFDFRGRASRAEYWWFQVFAGIAGLIAEFVFVPVGARVPGPASVIVFVILVVPQTAVTVRRLHDSDRTAWWLLLSTPGYLFSFIPDGLFDRMTGVAVVLLLASGVAGLVFFWFMIQKGDAWENRYGPNPAPDAVLGLSRPGGPP